MIFDAKDPLIVTVINASVPHCKNVNLLYTRHGVDGIGTHKGWNEEINSVPVTDELHEGRVPMKLLDSYLFPVVKPKSSTRDSSNA